MKKDEHLELLLKIGRAITSEKYLDNILQLIVQVVANTIGSPICSIMLLNEKKELVIKATQSVSKLYNEKPPLKLGEGVAGKVAQSGEIMVVDDVTKCEEYKYKNIAQKENLVSLLCLPLKTKNGVLGVLNCYTSKPYKFSKREIEVISIVANHAALIIENTNLLIQTKIIEEELETRKLVERAKGILMKEKKIEEDAAYRLLQKYSMDTRKSLKEIAEAIITSYDLSKGL